MIICSMCKEVGKSIQIAVEEYMEDGDNCGLFGTTWVANMASGLVSIGYGDASATQQVSDDLKNEVRQIADRIISGEIAVETTR